MRRIEQSPSLPDTMNARFLLYRSTSTQPVPVSATFAIYICVVTTVYFRFMASSDVPKEDVLRSLSLTP